MTENIGVYGTTRLDKQSTLCWQLFKLFQETNSILNLNKCHHISHIQTIEISSNGYIGIWWVSIMILEVTCQLLVGELLSKVSKVLKVCFPFSFLLKTHNYINKYVRITLQWYHQWVNRDITIVWVRGHVELPMLSNINTPPKKEFQLVSTNKPTTSILP